MTIIARKKSGTGIYHVMMASKTPSLDIKYIFRKEG